VCAFPLATCRSFIELLTEHVLLTKHVLLPEHSSVLNESSSQNTCCFLNMLLVFLVSFFGYFFFFFFCSFSMFEGTVRPHRCHFSWGCLFDIWGGVEMSSLELLGLD